MKRNILILVFAVILCYATNPVLMMQRAVGIKKAAAAGSTVDVAADTSGYCENTSTVYATARDEDASDTYDHTTLGVGQRFIASFHLVWRTFIGFEIPSISNITAVSFNFYGNNNDTEVDFDMYIVGATGDLTITPSGGDIFPVGYVRPSQLIHTYGGFQDSSLTIDLTVNTWAHITNPAFDLWAAPEVDGFSFAGDTITSTYTCDIDGIMAATFNGTAQKEYRFRLWNITQARQEGYSQGVTGNGANNYVQISLPVYVEATAGDLFRFEVQNISGDEDIEFHGAIFKLIYVHE